MKKVPTVKITVFGLGYVGLSNAALLAQHNAVSAVDVVEDKVALVNQGVSPVVDKELEEFLHSGKLRLTATTDAADALAGADYAVVATPTNYDEDTNEFDTSSVEAVFEQVNRINPDTTVVIKSTVPVGFTDRMQTEYPNLTVLFSPEFLREGRALYDNLHPSRIIVAGDDTPAREFAQLLLDGATDDAPVLITRPTEAEAVKLFSNTYLALRVAYFNELDTFALEQGLDASQIMRGVSLDPRIGDYYNNPSFGYGGYCLPKDTKQLRANYQEIPQQLMSAVINSNETRMQYLADRVIARRPAQVGVFKLAMKSGSDNARSSSVLTVIEKIRAADVNVVVYDPATDPADFPELTFSDDLKAVLEDSDVILANRWSPELEPVQEKVFTRDLYRRD